MWTLPNIITLVRICFTPVIALLPFIEGYWPKLIAFIIFIAAAVSDIYDGHLARCRNEVTDLGKLLDPIADSAHVDERRRTMGLPTLAEYLRLIDSVFKSR